MPDRRFILTGLAAAGAVAGSVRWAGARQGQNAFGRFDSEFVGRFKPGGQSAVVERPLTFTDPKGTSWTTPAGVEVNGASIPSALWSIVGSPFTGPYLRASVIHDHYCVTMERDWKETHEAFYNGCRADGASRYYANMLYAGVMRFGPRWRRRRSIAGGDARPRRIDPAFDQKEFDDLQRWIETDDPSLEAIARRVS